LSAGAAVGVVGAGGCGCVWGLAHGGSGRMRARRAKKRSGEAGRKGLLEAPWWWSGAPGRSRRDGEKTGEPGATAQDMCAGRLPPPPCSAHSARALAADVSLPGFGLLAS
jgi:hypothetical protein